MINIKGLNYKDILKDINIEISKGEFVSLVGSNGSGKTTLAMILSNLVYDEPISEKFEVAKRPAIVFENPDNQIIGTTVEEDIAFGLQNRQMSREEMHRKIDEVLEKLNILELKERDIQTLSGGQKQKVAFASLLSLDYEFYILDEVTSMLDPESKEMVINLIKELNNEGKTIIQITHFIEELELTERTIVMDSSKIVFDGKTSDLLNDKELLIKNRLI